MIKLRNFSAKELGCPCGACSPTERLDIISLRKLQRLRDLFKKPMIVNSAARCVAHNKAVGGSRHSKHLTGQAFDISIRDWSTSDVGRFVILARECGFNGIGLYETFIHIDTRKNKFHWTA